MHLAAHLPRLLIACAALACGGAQAQLPPVPVSPAPVTRLEYDAQGNPTRTVLAPNVPGLNLSTASSYDRLNRRKDTTDARTKTTLFEYNGREDLTQVTDPRSLITRYPRNGLGDAIELISPDTGTTQNTYDAAGNLKTRLDSRGVTAAYSYDALNRLYAVDYSKQGETSMSVFWGYDQTGAGFTNGIGRLTSTQFPGGSSTYAYDPQGRLLSTTQAVTSGSTTAPLTTGYGYDGAGRITSITYPSGRVLYITHSGGVPTALSLAPNANAGSAALPLVSNLQFEPSPGGQGVARSWLWELSSGTQLNERVFDVYGRMVRYPLGGAIRDLTYDAADRISSYTHYNASSGTSVAALDQGFGYDELGRLTSVSTSVGSWTFVYDDNGNRTLVSTTAGASSSTRAYAVAENSNRLLGLDNPTRALAHDAAGNTYSDLQDRVGWTGTHDLAGRLVNLSSSPDGSSAYVTRYTYNAEGQRVLVTPVSASCIGPSRTCAAIATRRAAIIYVYDQQGMLLGEYSSDGTPVREYVWLQGMPLAVIDGAPANPLIYYVQADHLDTPRTVIDRAGRQRWSWLAEPFGNSAPINNPLGFGVFNLNLRMPGQYWDRESGLVHNWHRTYDAGIGRYTQSDPIGLAGGINTYAYAHNQPTRYADPSGLVVWNGYLDVLSGQAAGAGGGAVISYRLVSECVRGQRFVVSGSGLGAFMSLGWKVGASTSAVTFDDGLDYINPFVFNGSFDIVSAGASFGIGYGWTGINLGGAHSPWSRSAYNGRDFGISSMTGRSKVDSVKMEQCTCEPN